ncbi:Phosducin-like protein 2 [Smittium culicis]|uniref:Phosducin-like protein 2 n=1 Tax=Smittium culicis TaxID=133412 RepID=A0A1R1XZV4_9FUNG|nr:Phosducin-like protein 2 [Smittium culicis]
MHELASKGNFGELVNISKPDYEREVTVCSRDGACAVAVHLYAPGVEESLLVTSYFQKLAREHPSTKFVNIEGTKCIDKYPLVNMPTLIFYKNGNIVNQLVRIDKLGGVDMTMDTFTAYLRKFEMI